MYRPEMFLRSVPFSDAKNAMARASRALRNGTSPNVADLLCANALYWRQDGKPVANHEYWAAIPVVDLFEEFARHGVDVPPQLIAGLLRRRRRFSLNERTVDPADERLRHAISQGDEMLRSQFSTSGPLFQSFLLEYLRALNADSELNSFNLRFDGITELTGMEGDPVGIKPFDSSSKWQPYIEKTIASGYYKRLGDPHIIKEYEQKARDRFLDKLEREFLIQDSYDYLTGAVHPGIVLHNDESSEGGLHKSKSLFSKKGHEFADSFI